MNILLSGSSGLIGSALAYQLSSKGHAVKSLVRRRPNHPSEISWDPTSGGPAPETLDGIDAVVHLAGESIASGRWSQSKKKAIRDSRVLGTRLLTDTLIRMRNPPKVLITASAIGFYGDHGPDVVREESPAGSGFLAEVCQDWEAAAAPAATKGIRVVHARLGIVLSPKGGALAKMLVPFKIGFGGKIGSGDQVMSWVALDDAVGAVLYALFTDSLRGSMNVTAPHAVTNAAYTRTLGKILGRPALIPLPAFAARLVFGEMADALLLSSARVEPAALLRAGYRFHYPDLEGALRHLLNK